MYVGKGVAGKSKGGASGKQGRGKGKGACISRTVQGSESLKPCNGPATGLQHATRALPLCPFSRYSRCSRCYRYYRYYRYYGYYGYYCYYRYYGYSRARAERSPVTASRSQSLPNSSTHLQP